MLILSWHQSYPADTHLRKARCGHCPYQVFINAAWDVLCFLGMVRFHEVVAIPWAYGRRTPWEISMDIYNQSWIKWFKPNSVSISNTAFDWQDPRTHGSLWQVVNSLEGTQFIICRVRAQTWIAAFSLAKGPFWSPCHGRVAWWLWQHCTAQHFTTWQCFVQILLVLQQMAPVNYWSWWHSRGNTFIFLH